MKNGILWFLISVLIMFGAAYAAPDPVIYLPFDGDLDNYGTAAPDTGYFTTEGGRSPGFGPGVIGGALDLRMAPRRTVAYDNGTTTITSEPMGRAVWGVYDPKAHDFNDPNTWPVPGDANSIDPTLLAGPAVDTPMELALDDVKSFTLMCWIKSTSLDGYRTNSTVFTRPHPFNILTGQSQEAQAGTGAMRLMTMHEWGSTRIYVNGTKSDGGYPALDMNQANNNWQFIAVTYDSTLATFNHVKWYTGWLDEPSLSQATIGYVLNHPMINLGHHEPFSIGNSHPYSAGGISFKGMIDEFRIFVSKTDGSGALSRSDIESYYLEPFEENICGGVNRPTPVGDLNYDCRCDIQDIDLLAGRWLDNNFKE